MDDPAPVFCGKYVVSLPGTLDPIVTPPLGWLIAASDGSLMLQYDAFPLDGSGFFNCYALATGLIVFQAAATGKYLALGESIDSGSTAINASAAAPDQALQLYAVRNPNVYTNVLLFGSNPMGLVGCYFSIYNPTFNSKLAPNAAWQSFSLMCVLPGDEPIPAAPPLVGKLDYAMEMHRTEQRATAALAKQRSGWRRAMAGSAASETAADPATPYFCGKFAVILPDGWVFRSGDPSATPPIPPAVGITQAFPADGSGVFVCYRQPPITWNPGQQNMLAMSWQTIPGPWSHSSSAAAQPAGGFLDVSASGPNVIVNAGVTAVAKAPQFCAFSPDQGPVFILSRSPGGGWYVEPSSSDDNPVLGISNDASQWTRPLVPRLVAGLQDFLTPRAKNWWYDADLSYVDMTTCVGSLTGAAAQWGNANFTSAVLTNMDLTAITIGNAVNFTSASLAGVTFKAGQDLSNAILKDADLSGVDLSAVKVPADFTGTNLTNAVLKGVNLSRATCVGTNFSGCDLTTTRLPTATGALGQGSTGAIFAGATVPLTSADTMVHVDRLGSDWRNLNLSVAKFVPLPAIIVGLKADYANLEKTILDEMTFIKDTRNNGASFLGANLTGASLRGVSAEGANFSSAILYAANLSKADLSSTTWSNAFAGTRQQLFSLSPFGAADIQTLNGTPPSVSPSVPDDLNAAFADNGHVLRNPQVQVRSNSSAWLITDGGSAYSVVVSRNALAVLTAGQTSAQFVHAYMENANLTGGSFTGVHFGGVQLINGANASGVDFEQADFSGANISSANSNQPNLAGAYLYGANLAGAFLFNADLSGAYLSPSGGPTGANLSGAMLANATLTGAQLDGAIMTGAFVALNPYGAPTSFCGVPLFTLDANKFTPILNDGGNWGNSAPSPLQDAFQANGFSLSGPAFFTAYPGQLQWGISLTDADMDPPPPPPAAAGWVWTAFMIMQGDSQYQGTDALIVYGTMLWMFAPDVTGVLQPEPYVVTSQTLDQTDIAETTYCPNSNTWATNAANRTPWEAAMMPVPQSLRDRS